MTHIQIYDPNSKHASNILLQIHSESGWTRLWTGWIRLWTISMKIVINWIAKGLWWQGRRPKSKMRRKQTQRMLRNKEQRKREVECAVQQLIAVFENLTTQRSHVFAFHQWKQGMRVSITCVLYPNQYYLTLEQYVKINEWCPNAVYITKVCFLKDEYQKIFWKCIYHNTDAWFVYVIPEWLYIVCIP